MAAPVHETDNSHPQQTHPMKTSLITLGLFSLIGLAQAQIVIPERPEALFTSAMAITTTTGLSSISDVRMNAAIASIDTVSATPYFIFSNVRATSATTTLADLLRVRYPVTKTSLDLRSAQVEVFKNIGVFDEINTLFIKNVPAIPAMKFGTSTTSYASGLFHTFATVNGATPFVFDLQSGHSLGFYFDSLSTPCYVALTRSATAPKPTEFTGLIASNFYQHKLGVLDSGKYYLWLKPQTGSSARVRFAFFNENASALGSAANNSIITGSLRSQARDYLKWKIRLVKDQDLIVSQTAGGAVTWHVISDDSTVVGTFIKGGSGALTFSPLINAPQTGDYYLIAEKAVTTSGMTVRATVKIAP